MVPVVNVGVFFTMMYVGRASGVKLRGNIHLVFKFSHLSQKGIVEQAHLIHVPMQAYLQ